MDSKHFSKLLAAKRIEAGMSVEELAEKMGVTYLVIKDIELGSYNTYMELAMNYLNALDLQLVLMCDSESEPIAFSTYRELAKWCASRWPSYYQFRETGVDANGVRHIKVSGQGVDANGHGISRQKFLELVERDGYMLEIINSSQMLDLEVQHQQLLRAKRKKDSKDQLHGCLLLLGGISALGVFVYVVIWITLHLPEDTFDNIGFIGAIMSLNPAFGLIFPFIVVAVCLILIIYIAWFVIKKLP